MMELIQQIGFLPLLDSGIEGFFRSHAFVAGCTWRKHRGMDGNESLAP